MDTYKVPFEYKLLIHTYESLNRVSDKFNVDMDKENLILASMHTEALKRKRSVAIEADSVDDDEVVVSAELSIEAPPIPSKRNANRKGMKYNTKKLKAIEPPKKKQKTTPLDGLLEISDK